MKKLFLTILMLILLVSSNSYAAIPLNTDSAIGNRLSTNAAERSTAKITQAANLTDDLKSRADNEIQRRLTALNTLMEKVNNFKRLSTAEKSDLDSQIQTQIDGLTALKTKIDADTDITTLRADVKSIITDYRIFAFFIRDINLISASERIQTVLDNLNAVYNKLQARITQAQNNGQDVTSLDLLLNDFKTQLDNATSSVNAVTSELTGLTVQGYPGNETTLQDAKSNLKTSFADIKTAFSDAKQIIQGLIALGVSTKNSSSSAAVTP